MENAAFAAITAPLIGGQRIITILEIGSPNVKKYLDVTTAFHQEPALSLAPMVFSEIGFRQSIVVDSMVDHAVSRISDTHPGSGKALR